MTQQPTVTAEGHAHAVAPEVRHEHTSACFWHVEDCRWQCTTYPLLRYALEHCSPTAQTVEDNGPEARS
jgi:hypothetical protein